MDSVTISTARYKQLVENEKELNRLRAAGVDNWEGYPAFDDEDFDEED